MLALKAPHPQDRAEQIQQEVFVLQEELQESETLAVGIVCARM